MITGMCEHIPPTTVDKTLPEIARDALDVLDRDGWCRGATLKRHSTAPDMYADLYGEVYPEGSHCIAGLLNMSMWGNSEWHLAGSDIYRVVGEKIQELYGWENPHTYDEDDDPTFAFTVYTSLITSWNDKSAKEPDVRAVLEKLAADG